MKTLILFLITCVNAVDVFSQAELQLNFINTASGKPVVLRDSTYVNPHGEEYTIKKLRYYIGGPTAGNYKEHQEYFLIDQARNLTLSTSIEPGTYESVSFLLGVDSLHNCSGAQEGALDPMNDMFWTWNTGYVMFKLEGTSPASKGDLNRIEHHIGGYRFDQDVSTIITVPVKKFTVKAGEKAVINLNMDLDRYWNGKKAVRISEYALCMSPGETAKYIASNFPGLFIQANESPQ